MKIKYIYSILFYLTLIGAPASMMAMEKRKQRKLSMEEIKRNAEKAHQKWLTENSSTKSKLYTGSIGIYNLFKPDVHFGLANMVDYEKAKDYKPSNKINKKIKSVFVSWANKGTVRQAQSVTSFYIPTQFSLWSNRVIKIVQSYESPREVQLKEQIQRNNTQIENLTKEKNEQIAKHEKYVRAQWSPWTVGASCLVGGWFVKSLWDLRRK